MEFIPGVKGATGSATLLYYGLEGDETSQYIQFNNVIDNIIKKGAVTEDSNELSMSLEVGSENASDDPRDNIQFKCFITSANISVSTGELTAIQINFTVNGDFTDTITN